VVHAVLADVVHALGQPVGEGDGVCHQHIRLVAGVTEHQALVTGALVFRLLPVDTLGDIGRLLADDVDHTAGIGVVADFGGSVADILDDAAYQVFQVDPGAGGDLATNDGDRKSVV